MGCVNGVAGKLDFDVVALRDGERVRHWPWWAADKPRRARAKYMVLDGVRYQVEMA